MKIHIRAAKIHAGNHQFAVAMFCGESWYKISSWRHYDLFGRLETARGFHIGPVMFWDGS